jgi:class 3 adenylate cyclase
VSDLRPVTDEPARGLVPPPWIYSLPGMERMLLFARRYLAAPPSARLYGLSLGHVSIGSATATMKASSVTQHIPALNISPVVLEALQDAATTALEPGMDVVPITYTLEYFRNPRPQPGNFLARARIINTSNISISCAADVEDPVGRLVGTAISQWGIEPVMPSPPAAPVGMEPIDEPTYATPDPPDRPPVGAVPPLELSQRYGGLELIKMLIGGELPSLPLMNTLGMRFENAEEGDVALSMPASEWLCMWNRSVSPAGIDPFLGAANASCTATLFQPGQSVAIIECNTRFFRRVPADGRLMRARSKVTLRNGNLVNTEAIATDEEGHPFAAQQTTNILLDPRAHRPGEQERVLATLLFTDIVGSTVHAERLGDTKWRSLLAEHDKLVRQELGAHKGREVKTTGDGFLVRFDSPAAAIRCARAIRDGVRRLNLEIRAGIHIGECEVHGTDLAGIALHVAARIMALAGNNEILVSQMVRDLAAGSGVHFGAAERHALRGVEGEWNLFRVED